MTLGDAKELLVANGYEVETRTVVKNGLEVDALSIGTGTEKIRPTIYSKTIENMEDDDEILSYVQKIICDVPEIDVSVMQDKEYIFSHCRSCIRHASDDESIVKWPVEDLEEYLRIDLGDGRNGSMSCVVSKALINSLNIDAEELRMYGRRNLSEIAEIKSMEEILSEMMGESFPGIEDAPAPTLGLYVGTTKNKVQGAAILLLSDLLDAFCLAHALDEITIIPSSTEEILLVTEKVSDDVIDRIIRDVNLEVDEWSILSDHCYHHRVTAA